MDTASIIKQLHRGHQSERLEAALTLGFHPMEGGTAALVKQLAEEWNEQVIRACCASLEMIGDLSVAPRLARILREKLDSHPWGIGHTLSRLTGVDPLTPTGADASTRHQALLEAIDHPPLPRVQWLGQDEFRVELEIQSAHPTVQSYYLPPARVNYSSSYAGTAIHVNETPLYTAGAWISETCEAYLSHLGWPRERAHALSQALAASVEKGATLSESWVQLWEPVLTTLPSGTYQGIDLRLPLETVKQAERSWFNLRDKMRYGECDDQEQDTDQGEPFWLGTRHYQGPTTGSRDSRSFWLALPSQAEDKLNEERVRHYEKRIKQGERPTAVCLAWIDARDVFGLRPETFFYLLIIDGHHKLEAYARCGVHASVIALFSEALSEFGLDDLSFIHPRIDGQFSANFIGKQSR